MPKNSEEGSPTAGPSDHAVGISEDDLFAKLSQNALIQMGLEEPEQDPEPVDEDTPESEEPEGDHADEAADDDLEGQEEDFDEELPPGFEEEPEENPEDGGPNKDREVVSKKTFEKRLGKATARIKRLEAERDQLQQQLTAQPAVMPDATNPLMSVTTSAELAQQERQASQLLEQISLLKIKARRDPEAVAETLEKEGIQVEDPETWLEEKSHHLNQVLLRHIPERRTFIQQRENLSQQAQTKYPWLKDTSDAKTQWVESVKALYPQLAMTVPDIDLFLARAHAGWTAEARARISSKKQPVRQPGKPKVSGVSRKRINNPMAAAQKHFKETGDDMPIFNAMAAQAIQKRRANK